VRPSATGIYGLAFKYTERPFDTARGIFYTVGSYEIDIVAEVYNFCSPQDTLGLELRFANQQKQQTDSCGITSSILKTSQAMQPGSIEPGATDFSVFSLRRQAPEPVRNAEMLDAHTVKINYFFPLTANDTIRIISKVGADGNRVLNACGFDQSEGDTLYQIVDGCASVALPEHQALNISVYPNPSRGFLQLANNSKQSIMQIKVYNLQGIPLLEINNPKNRVDLSALASGSYILSLTLENGRRVQKKISLL